MKTLKTERLTLRPWKLSDASSLYQYAKDERVGPIAGWPIHKSVEESAEIIRTIFMRDEVYAVTLIDDDLAIGLVGLSFANESNFLIGDNDAEVSYWIGVPFWGKGLIPEAVKEISRHSFETLELDNLWCGYFADNEKSQKTQEKCGFKFHHVIEERYMEFLDEVKVENICRLTKDEWIEIQEQTD
ncbi:GNAT family N-acetyltransferase [Proteus penneri]|uniref:Putative ribosomal N-acetyltransferase YdaF n=1 Tax=Proteus penneri TaxID=102862 RepID=A0A0G4Q9M5_9GAMM|nr:GNAT family N-acetyltransferase [Proteus penneri]CRL62558.1 Putative ribosomal N-acetyltransferase YdaF [Proteus penneri]